MYPAGRKPANLQLHVHVVEAANLPRADFLGQSDLYMTLQLSNVAARQSTSVIRETQSPIWNQEFHFALPDQAGAVLTATVRNRGVLGNDAELAELQLPLSQIILYHVTDAWYNMRTLGGQGAHPAVRIILQIAPDAHPAFHPMPGIGPPAQPPRAWGGPPARAGHRK